jgi:hypothetical protein
LHSQKESGGNGETQAKSQEIFMVTNILTVMGLSMATAILLLLRRDMLQARRAMPWLGITAGFLIISIFPHVVDRVAAHLGINYGPSLVMAGAICGLLIKILSMEIEQARVEVQYRVLNQRMAVLETKIRYGFKDSTTQSQRDN